MEPKDSDVNDSTSMDMDISKDPVEDTPLATPSSSGDPPPIPPLSEDKCEGKCPSPKQLDNAHHLKQRILTSLPEATPSASQTTPSTRMATPIRITSSASSSNSLCTNSFYSLLNRHTVVDCYATLPALKRKLYGLPSMVQRLSLESRLKEHHGCVNCIDFSWAGHLLASGSDDLQVVLWNWASGKMVGKFDTGHVANVFQVNKEAWGRG